MKNLKINIVYKKGDYYLTDIKNYIQSKHKDNQIKFNVFDYSVEYYDDVIKTANKYDCDYFYNVSWVTGVKVTHFAKNGVTSYKTNMNTYLAMNGKPRVSKTEELQRWTACTLPSQKKYLWSKGGQKYLRYLIDKDMENNNDV